MLHWLLAGRIHTDHGNTHIINLKPCKGGICIAQMVGLKD